MDYFIFEILLLFLFLLLSAFFSGSETALFSLKKSDLHLFSLSKNKRENKIAYSMAEPQKILITILLGNLFANFIVTNLSTYRLLQLYPNYGHLITIAIITPCIILFCEIMPKVIAISSYTSFSRIVYPFLNVFHKILAPLRGILLIISNSIIRIFKLKLSHKNITKDELGHVVKLGEREGVIEKEEGHIIHNVLRFSKKDASNIMFPRNSAVFIPHGSSIKDAMKIFYKAGVIRAPIYKKDFDHVIGFVDSRDLLPSHLGFKKASNINKFIQPIEFFPATRNMSDLLSDFLNKGIQLAIVVDEYGGTAGVVTMNSILMELTGKEFNKWEVDYKPEIKRVDDNVTIISGKMQIEDFNYNFNENLVSSESDSIGGYIIEKLAAIPKRGEIISTDKYILRVRYIKKNKIETVEVIQWNRKR